MMHNKPAAIAAQHEIVQEIIIIKKKTKTNENELKRKHKT